MGLMDAHFHNNGTRRADATPFVAKTAAFDVTYPDDHGRVFSLALAAGFEASLPSAADTEAGFAVTFVSALAPTSGAGYVIGTDGTDSVAGGGITVTSAKGICNTQATAKVGDSVTLVSDGSSKWYVSAIGGTWAVES